MLQEEGWSDALLRFGNLIGLEEGADRQNQRAVEHYAEDDDAFQNHALNATKERPVPEIGFLC